MLYGPEMDELWNKCTKCAGLDWPVEYDTGDKAILTIRPGMWIKLHKTDETIPTDRCGFAFVLAIGHTGREDALNHWLFVAQSIPAEEARQLVAEVGVGSGILLDRDVNFAEDFVLTTKGNQLLAVTPEDIGVVLEDLRKPLDNGAEHGVLKVRKEDYNLSGSDDNIEGLHGEDREVHNEENDRPFGLWSKVWLNHEAALFEEGDIEFKMSHLHTTNLRDLFRPNRWRLPYKRLDDQAPPIRHLRSAHVANPVGPKEPVDSTPAQGTTQGTTQSNVDTSLPSQNLEAEKTADDSEADGGSSPPAIPDRIRRSADRINACPEDDRVEGLPKRSWLREQCGDLVVGQHYVLRAFEPLREYAGDERLFTSHMWAWLLFWGGHAAPPGDRRFANEYEGRYEAYMANGQ